MYRVLLADDESLISSGEYSMLDANNKQLGTMKNATNDTRRFVNLRDYIFWDLVNGDVQKRSCHKGLPLHGMEFSKQYYNVSILHFEHDQKLTMYKQVQSYIEENYPATCFCNPDQELIIIFGANKKDELLTYNYELSRHYLNEVNQLIGEFYLSMGAAVTSVEALRESYAVAKGLSLYEIVLEPNQLITNITPISKEQLFKNQQEIKTKIVKSIMAGKENIKEDIQLFLDVLQYGKKFISSRVVRKYMIDLISYIHHSLQIGGYNKHALCIERIFYAVTIQEMIMIIQNYCDELADNIQEKNDAKSPIVQNVLKFMHSNYNQELSLKTLGNRFRVNPNYLGQLFIGETGVSFSEYMNDYRLEKSKLLLKHTHLRVGEVGKQVGYADTTYFYKQFKRNVGVTPTVWRNI